ncbi:4705_t:CDS:2 [Rhizophagus irregularis]|nr:4705_t:CDS:2 [Rhizophagus irregularis]
MKNGSMRLGNFFYTKKSTLYNGEQIPSSNQTENLSNLSSNNNSSIQPPTYEKAFPKWINNFIYVELKAFISPHLAS